MGYLRDRLSKLTAGLDQPRVIIEGGDEPIRQAQARELRDEAARAGDGLAEIKVVGESYRQDTLAAISGPREPEGKSFRVGATLRCEPENPHDGNAVRVEVMGQLVGYVERSRAAVLGPAMRNRCRGVLEARGVIVGAWDNGATAGSYGIRVWITKSDLRRIGLAEDLFDPVEIRAWAPMPSFPVEAGERRLSPESDGYVNATVTVTGEEHYQPAILATRPDPWERDYWPVLVTLDVVDVNPHAKKATPCVRVSIGDEPVGYLTASMSERHRPAIDAALRAGFRATAVALVKMTTKKSGTMADLKLALPGPK
jgi:hypothetical protein